MKAWGETLDPAGTQGVSISPSAPNFELVQPLSSYQRSPCLRFRQIRFFADPTGEFTHKLDMAFDGSAIFGGDRSKRYTIVIEQGKVKSVAVEPDNTGTSVSLAEHVLGSA